MRCRAFPEYDDQTKTFTHSAPKRAKKVRNIAAAPGPLAPFAADLMWVVDRFEQGHETRNLLAHGFCEFLFTKAGKTGFYFQKFHHQQGRDETRLIRTFTPEAMQQEADTFVALADESLKLFARIHAHFGWVGLRPS